jgi:hypothetical protein
MLLPVAAFAVHQLRYLIAYGSNANSVLASQGHSYLNSLAPWLVLLIGVAVGSFLLRVARALSAGADARPRRSFLGLWALASVSLLAIYTTQELLEGFFAAGHPSGIAGVFGHGGWWAAILSPAIGLVVAALLRLASRVVSVAARIAARPPLFLGHPPLVRRLGAVVLVPRAPLAYAAAGRAPPAV